MGIVFKGKYELRKIMFKIVETKRMNEDSSLNMDDAQKREREKKKKKR